MAKEDNTNTEDNVALDTMPGADPVPEEEAGQDFKVDMNFEDTQEEEEDEVETEEEPSEEPEEEAEEEDVEDASEDAEDSGEESVLEGDAQDIQEPACKLCNNKSRNCKCQT